MPESPVKITPMLEQYLSIKADYPDALLFYRMGDFYEMFYEDALTAARELQITLTSRNKESANPVPMCGVPWHSVQSYIAQLIEKGYHVAVCDQTEDPKLAKGLVNRDVTCVITPGTVLEDASLDVKTHNYLGSVYYDDRREYGGFVWADISTGQWSGVEFKHHPDLWQWVRKLKPRELLIPEDLAIPSHALPDETHPLRMPKIRFDLNRATEILLISQEVREPDALGLKNKPEVIRACGALLTYLNQTQLRASNHLGQFNLLNLSRHLLIDEVTERNLEIFTRFNGQKGKGTLRHTLDDTITPMGGRLLGDMLRHPWREAAPIRRIQEAVLYFYNDDNRRTNLRNALNKVYDLERLSTRIKLNRAHPRDFIALRDSLAALPQVYNALQGTSDELSPNNTPPQCIQQIIKNWDPLGDCHALLHSALLDNPPTLITEGGLFKNGYHADLDRLIELAEHGEQKLQLLLTEEQQAVGGAKLKLGYNRVFGYYYELSRAQRSVAVPEYFIRRQTLANAERFTTPALKKLEEEILASAEARKNLEYTLFQELREHIASQRERVIHMADVVAQMDYWQSLAQTGRKNNWVMPTLTDDANLKIREGRHPVVEFITGSANFVPNSFCLDQKRRLCLLTGPNMAGKSTVLRQVAIICLLAQTGSMVPASEATLGIVDRLFSRVGASDDLVRDQSTFMVEMMETARILRQATKRSLIILDEIGRGTSTYDGLALAWAVVEDLAKRTNGSLRTLFATHYHELTALEGRTPGVFTMNIAIREYNNDILFLHKLVPGPSDRSYGVEVARLAGVPAPVVQRAKQILAALEQSREGTRKMTKSVLISLTDKQEASPFSQTPANLPHRNNAASQEEHPLIRQLQKISLEAMTPLDALKLLTEWKQTWAAPASDDARTN
ncbi:MAG: DNA mismatch repair protein MutS [Desulfovibrio sp.]|jgi:DNA mismatch repair protein MutS|nr:DNA mismatch repair protein MutS [Desulfovibrio sp.]